MDKYLRQFCDEVEGYLSKTGIDPTNFGKSALKDPRFVFDLRLGRQPRFSTIQRVREYMDGAQT